MGRKKHAQQDKNFDGLGARFQRNIYSTMKGQLRIAVLRRDFDDHVAGAGLNVLDVGAGQGHWALELLGRGHSVTLTDVSSEMLALAEQNISSSELEAAAKKRARFVQCPVQELQAKLGGQFDLIVCHAVMEWLDQPQVIFANLLTLLHDNGLLSVIFYNRDGLIFKNMLRTNYSKVLARDFRGARGSLTPANPLDPKEVQQWALQAGLEMVCHSGIRVFHDYILAAEERNNSPEQVLALELEYSRKPPFRDLGRYIHFLLRKA